MREWTRRLAGAALGLGLAWVAPAAADQVIADDLIAQSSLCVGLDCVNGENFGFDTIRLKENNLRIHFDDTSTGTFPATDWRITVNDSASGGASYFAIEDATAGTRPFTVEAGARASALVVAGSGRVGVGTATPVEDLHVLGLDSPTLRLHQAGGPFGEYRWDVAGNEANFFVRDAMTNELPLRIRPGAPGNSLIIDAAGRVGLGVEIPAKQLDLKGASDDGGAANATMIRVENGAPSTKVRRLLDLANNGAAQMAYRDTATDRTWTAGLDGGGSFVVKRNGSASPELTLRRSGALEIRSDTSGLLTLRLQSDGDLQIAGTLAQSSDRNTKTAFVPVDATQVLTAVAALPINTWQRRADAAGVRHLGPNAQDFHAAFGVGGDDRHIAPLDAAGVALAAIQALHAGVRQRDARIAGLEEEQAALRERVQALEALVRRLAAGR